MLDSPRPSCAETYSSIGIH